MILVFFVFLVLVLVLIVFELKSGLESPAEGFASNGINGAIYSDGGLGDGGYLPGGLVKCYGVECALIIIVDGLQDGFRTGEYGEGIAGYVDDDAPAVPVARG